MGLGCCVTRLPEKQNFDRPEARLEIISILSGLALIITEISLEGRLNSIRRYSPLSR